MSVLTVRAPAKVNLVLLLGGRRDDGRHELVTVFQSISLADELVISVAERDEVVCPAVAGPNLVQAAIHALRAHGWDGPPLRVRIDKRVPVAGGMGGGSGDAAALLRGARELAPIDPETLAEIALALGADVPSQLSLGVALGTGAGDIIDHRPPLAPHALLIVPSPHALSTAEVYREADRLGLARTDADLVRWRGEVDEALRAGGPLPEHLIRNDLASAALSLCAPIADALSAVEREAADGVIVSGSGPTVVGVYWGADSADRAAEAASALQSQFPGAMAAAPIQADYGNPRIA